MLQLKRLWFRITGKLGLWPLWCKVYQWLNWDREYICRGRRLWWQGLEWVEAIKMMQILTWKPDGWKELWDAAHHPHRVNYAMNTIVDGCFSKLREASGPKTKHDEFFEVIDSIDRNEARQWQPEMSLDCEDFALWAAYALYEDYQPEVLCVFWSTGWWPWQVEGHAVCMFQFPDSLEMPGNHRYGYMGNWPARWRDLYSVEDVVHNILIRSNKSEHDLVAVRRYRSEELMLKA